LEPGQWAREEIQLQGGGPVADLQLIFYAEGLEIRNVNEVEKSADTLRVLGEVHNGGATGATLVQVEAAIYNADGRYAGREFTFVDADVLLAGESSAFEIDGQIDAGPDWTYRLLVSGWPSS
ncbi:MAG: FxLYD domain-containing protein, partial [Chloroflexota bacterium]|nr:FxLYD domain-containing protein [Chloroflexota bacterium]